jgi:hypothetical protein
MTYVLKRLNCILKDIGFFFFIFLFVFLSSAIAYGAGTLAGTNIISGSAKIAHDDGIVYSKDVKVVVNQSYGIELSLPNFIGPITAGDSFYFPFAFKNVGNGTDVYRLGISGTTNGWRAELILDENNNGIHEIREVRSVDLSVLLAEAASYSLFLRLTAPAAASEGEIGTSNFEIAGSRDDGSSYLGTNGIYYGGPDKILAKIEAKVIEIDTSVPTITNLLVNEMATLPYNIVSTDINITADIADDLPSNMEEIIIMLDDRVVYQGTLSDWKGSYNPYSGRFECQVKIKKPGSYRLKVMAQDRFGNSSQIVIDQLQVFSPEDIRMVGVPTSAPSTFAPRRGEETAFQYILSSDALVSIYIHDIIGKILWNKNIKSSAGPNQVFWDGKSTLGKTLGNGIYFYKIVYNNKVLGSGKTTILEQ